MIRSPIPFLVAHRSCRLLRNSWSAAWGENGYMRLKRTRDLHCYDDPTPDDGAQCEAVPGPDKALRVCGDCGILFDVSYPLASEGPIFPMRCSHKNSLALKRS